MLKFLLRRTFWLLVTLWVVFTISLALMFAVPGGPFSNERGLDPLVERQLLETHKLDGPFYQIYIEYLADIVRFDFRHSLGNVDMTVNEIIAEGFPISAALGITAMAFALMLGLTAGILSAIKRYTAIDFSLMTVATVGIALPNFVVAGIAILLFVFLWPVFPPGGWGTFRQLVLPAFCLGAPYAAYIARLTRTGMLDVLTQDYIRTARAKGLMTHTVILRHALRGAMLPVVSFLGPAIAGILAGSLVVERIFAVPGLGVHFVEAALKRDYFLSMGCVLLYTTLLCVANIIVDIMYAQLDPRVKLE